MEAMAEVSKEGRSVVISYALLDDDYEGVLCNVTRRVCEERERSRRKPREVGSLRPLV